MHPYGNRSLATSEMEFVVSSESRNHISQLLLDNFGVQSQNSNFIAYFYASKNFTNLVVNLFEVITQSSKNLTNLAVNSLEVTAQSHQQD